VVRAEWLASMEGVSSRLLPRDCARPLPIDGTGCRFAAQPADRRHSLRSGACWDRSSAGIRALVAGVVPRLASAPPRPVSFARDRFPENAHMTDTPTEALVAYAERVTALAGSPGTTESS